MWSYILQINLNRNLSFCCCQVLCFVSSAKMEMRFYLKYPGKCLFSFWSFKMFMWVAWVWQKGICFFSWHPWARATVTMSQLPNTKDRGQSWQTQEEVKAQLQCIKSVLSGEEMFLAERQGCEQLLIQRELVVNCMPSLLWAKQPSGWLFFNPESAAEQEVDGSSKSHLSSTQSSRYKSVVFNEGLVANMKLFQAFSLQGGSYRHQITIWTSTNHRIHFIIQVRVRMDKKRLFTFSTLLFSCWACWL